MDADTNPINTDVSATTPDENEGWTERKYTVIKRVFLLLQLLLANAYTRPEIFKRLAPFYQVIGISTGKEASSRYSDRMFERDVKLLEEVGFEIQKIKARGKATISCFSSD